MNKSTPVTVLVITALVVAFVWHCRDSPSEADYFSPPVLATHANGRMFVGSESCRECHAEIYKTHIETAHFKTSARADQHSIKGSFTKGSNTVELQDAILSIKEDGGNFYEYQTPKFNDGKESISEMDLVIGSGVKGQSYLTWDNDKLFQLQASFYTPTNSWINSPNFPPFSTTRPITDACLKCHVTYAENKDTSGNTNQYYKDRILYGVDCERCHGPSLDHVKFHRKNPDAVTAREMISIDTLTRQQRLDICVQCHSGLRLQQLKGNPFSFVAGEDLETYSKNYYTGRPDTELDVHGNQFGLLKSSECFKKDSSLQCTTCHDPHAKQRGNTLHFNQKCMECHSITTGECSEDPAIRSTMGNNCIACHMPQAPSRGMKVQLDSESLEIPVYIRSHLIGIYPENPMADTKQ